LLNQAGVTALEFALLAPVYLFLLFGILEICFVLLFSMMLSWGADRAVEYLEQGRQNYRGITSAGLRQALCNAFDHLPVSCDASHLKIALINQDDPTKSTSAISDPVVDRFDAPNGGVYILALGYEWNFMFPTTGYVLPYAGPDVQIKTVNIAVLAERVTELLP